MKDIYVGYASIDHIVQLLVWFLIKNKQQFAIYCFHMYVVQYTQIILNKDCVYVYVFLMSDQHYG